MRFIERSRSLEIGVLFHIPFSCAYKIVLPWPQAQISRAISYGPPQGWPIMLITSQMWCHSGLPAKMGETRLHARRDRRVQGRWIEPVLYFSRHNSSFMWCNDFVGFRFGKCMPLDVCAFGTDTFIILSESNISRVALEVAPCSLCRLIFLFSFSTHVSGPLSPTIALRLLSSLDSQKTIRQTWELKHILDHSLSILNKRINEKK